MFEAQEIVNIEDLPRELEGLEGKQTLGLVKTTSSFLEELGEPKKKDVSCALKCPLFEILFNNK